MTPSEVRLTDAHRLLILSYEDGGRYELSAEYLRVHSPSAEVRGHGPGEEKLQVGKENVTITAIDPVGHYAIRLSFDDGHNTGLYSWTYLRELAVDKAVKWQDYLDRLKAAGYARDSVDQP